ncbi:MAG TPA: MoaD/ThiS family protein [Acidimicrobiales bacterium]|nr:MoaD/ThiS family protein [Acidimicrobiales bacterium]
MAVLRLFAAAREAAGTARDEVPGATVGDVLAEARARYGEHFTAVLAGSRVWLNGEPAADADAVGDGDEVAVLPPVSGGAGPARKLPAKRAGKRRDSSATSAAAANDVPDGPHVRLGLAWAAVTTVALTAGPVPLALWLAPTAGVAAAQVARTSRKKPQRPDIAAATAGAALVVVGSVGGPLGTAAGLVAAAAVAFARTGKHVVPLRTLTVSAPVGVAAAAPVVLRTDGFAHAFVLLALLWAYDSGNYVVGTGAGNRWEGPVAGIASIFAVSLAVAVVFAPPFEGAWPWVFAALVAVTAPVGERIATRLLGDRDAHVPVLRRIDSLLVAGPLFAAASLVVL